MILEFTSSSGQGLQDRLTFFRQLGAAARGSLNRMWFELDTSALAGGFAQFARGLDRVPCLL